MNIRTATYRDAPAIKLLLGELGYKASTSRLIGQLESLSGQNNHQVIVCEQYKEVLAFMAVHYIAQLAFDGEMMLISYFGVEESARDRGIGKSLEEYVVALARKRKCNRIEVHCQEMRTLAHRFYEQQGYKEYPRYYIKRLVYDSGPDQ